MAQYVIEDGNKFRVSVYTYNVLNVAVNSFLIEASVVGDPTVYLSEVALELETQLAPKYKDIITENANFGGVSVRPYTVFPGVLPRTEYSFTLTGPGLVAGDGLPTQTAAILNLASGTIGLKHQGRLYMPFPGVASNEQAGTPTAAYLGNVGEIGDILKTSILIPGTVGNCTVSAGTYDTTTGLFYRFDRYWQSDRWATQRRRSDYSVKNWVPHS